MSWGSSYYLEHWGSAVSKQRHLPGGHRSRWAKGLFPFTEVQDQSSGWEVGLGMNDKRDQVWQIGQAAHLQVHPLSRLSQRMTPVIQVLQGMDVHAVFLALNLPRK